MALDLLEERHCVSDAGLSTETIEHLVLPASFGECKPWLVRNIDLLSELWCFSTVPNSAASKQR